MLKLKYIMFNDNEPSGFLSINLKNENRITKLYKWYIYCKYIFKCWLIFTTLSFKKCQHVQVAEQNEVKSQCLHHIMNTITLMAFPAGVWWGLGRRLKKEKCQHIKEVRALNAKVNDWFRHYLKYQNAIFSKCESDLRQHTEWGDDDK